MNVVTVDLVVFVVVVVVVVDDDDDDDVDAAPAAAALALAAAAAAAAVFSLSLSSSSLGETLTPNGADSSLATAHICAAINPERPGKTPAVVIAGTPARLASASAERAS